MNSFRHGRTQDFLPVQFFEVGGTSMDFYADSGIPYTYTIELPDLGQYGFQLPESNLEEVRQSIVRLQLDQTNYLQVT